MSDFFREVNWYFLPAVGVASFMVTFFLIAPWLRKRRYLSDIKDPPIRMHLHQLGDREEGRQLFGRYLGRYRGVRMWLVEIDEEVAGLLLRQEVDFHAALPQKCSVAVTRRDSLEPLTILIRP